VGIRGWRIYDGDRLIAELGAGGTTVLRRYVHGAGVDEPVLWWEGSGTTDGRSLLADRQGSIIATAPLAGGTSAVSLYTYGPYGERTSWGGSRFAYTGQIALAEASLYHYKARAYDPSRGWFLQTDPVGYDAGDFNLYAYVGGDPVNKADPTGLCDPNTQCLTPPPEDKPKGWSCGSDSQCSSMPGDGAGGKRNGASTARDINKNVIAEVMSRNAHGQNSYNGKCARACRIGLQAGGVEVDAPYPKSAKDYGPILLKNGAKIVPPDGYKPQKGDVVVFQGGGPGNHPHGHIAIYDGKGWVSDTRQSQMAPNRSGYPGSYSIYRFPD
jgi:RHS repeat-associated protein